MKSRCFGQGTCGLVEGRSIRFVTPDFCGPTSKRQQADTYACAPSKWQEGRPKKMPKKEVKARTNGILGEECAGLKNGLLTD